jgi:cytochrome c
MRIAQSGVLFNAWMRRLSVAALVLALDIALIACSDQGLPLKEPISGGNAIKGKQLIVNYGCVSCHEIKGINHANGTVGPPLKGIRERTYVGGVVPNTGDNMVQWIMHPRQLSPKTAMPELGVSEADARDIAAYLYSQ